MELFTLTAVDKIVGVCQNSYIETYTKEGEFYLMQLYPQSKKKKKKKKKEL